MHAVAHVRPSRCPGCLSMLRLAHAKLREQKRKLGVLTWCLVCGEATTVEVARSYGEAVAFFHALDRQPMIHSGATSHGEADGWGHHWRLDEVLRVAYPVEAAHDRLFPYWPYPGWYRHTESANCQVQVITPMVYRLMKPSSQLGDRTILKDKLNAYPRTRSEIAKETSSEVLDENQMKRRFTFLGAIGPFAIVVNRDTGEQGTLVFQDEPRLYWGYSIDRMV